jgi:hypothetical protein
VKSRVARARLSLLNILQSRRLRRTKPATCTAFNEWLMQLDQLRIAACRILESAGNHEHEKLTAVPKIPLRFNSTANASAARTAAVQKTATDDDAYEALGSPAAARASIPPRPNNLRGLAGSLASPEFAAAS